jgi:rhodanese-related sulfurtransferase
MGRVLWPCIPMPLDALRGRLGELSPTQEIWVVCGVGQRAYYATRILLQQGYHVRHLSRGRTPRPCGRAVPEGLIQARKSWNPKTPQRLRDLTIFSSASP